MCTPIIRGHLARYLLALFACLALSQPLYAQSQKDLNEFSQVLLEYTYHLDNAAALPYRNFAASDKVMALSNDELKAFYDYMPDPEAFMKAARAVIEADQNAPGSAGYVPALDKSHPAAVGFPPDYPSGNNYDAFIATLPGLGLLPAGKTNRTSADGVGATYIAFHALQFTALAAQAVCDASLVAAPIACPIAGTANAAAMATQVVLNQTAYQDGLIDGAETEAAYENTVILIGQENDLAADLTAHDTDVKGALSTHDMDVKSSLSTHDADIKSVLNTQGADITSALNAHDTDIKSTVSTHDTEIKSALSTHDSDIKSALNTQGADITSALIAHDTSIKNALASHDGDVKALLANLQAGVDANSAKLDLLLSRQLETIRLLHTPEGRRSTDVPACDGGPCSWNY